MMVFSSIKVLLLLAYLSHTVHGEERAARSETHRLGAPDNHSQGLSNVVPDNNEFGSISDRLHRFTAAGGVQWHDAMIEALEAINLEMSLSMTVSDVELLGRPSLHKDDDDQTVLSDYPSTIPVVLSDFHSTNHEKYSDYPSTNPGELSDYPSSIPMVLSDLPSSFGGPLHNDDDDNQRVLSDYPSTIPGMFSDAPSFGVPSLHDDDDADQTVLSDDPSTIQVVLIDYPSASPAELSDSPSTIPAGVVSDYPSIIPVDDATGVILSTTTYAPTPLATSAAPTSVCEVTGEPRALRILAMLDQIADSDSVRDTNTPQGKATAWLIDEDALQVCPDSTTCQLVQRWVLAVIYFATNGDSWFNCSAIGTDDCGNVAPFDRGESRFLSVSSECEWAGISCIDSCVTKIEFEENNLVGIIPTEIGLLSQLAVWGMERGGLSGTIPTEIAKLTNLIFLDLDFNQLTGTLSSELLSLSNLTQLDLNGNVFTGSIEGIGVFPELVFLQLHDNHFTGTVPESIGNLSKLLVFTLHATDLSGTMPRSICDLVETGILGALIADCNQPVPGIDADIDCPCCTDCRDS